MPFPDLDLIQDWPAFVQDPLTKIDESLRNNNVQSGSLLEHHVRIFGALSHLPDHRLADIPSFNHARRLANKSLVRFTCMVQDMFDPEFYLARFETRNKETGEQGTGYGMYRDSFTDSHILSVDYDSTSNAMQDRMTYLCIAIPGENDWVRERQETKSEGEPMDSSEPDESPTVTSEQAMSSGDENVKSFKPNKEEAAKIRTSLNQCFPSIDGSAKKLAFVKVYDTRESALKLNDMIEVIGIMDIGEDATGEERQDPESANFAGALHLDENNFSLPAVVAPQIHALCVHKLHHLNPLVGDPRSRVVAGSSETVAADGEFCEKMRKELHALLSLCLFGDELAAEYLICCLISRIYSRQDILSLGSLSAGFSNLPRSSSSGTEMREYMKWLYQLMSSLVTHSVYLPMSLETLNGRSFVPQKDHSCNKLVSGQLQLAPETLLFVDETALEPGKLEERGLLNLKSLGELIKWQQLKYDFVYHSMEVGTDMKIMVFSEGKSLLPLNFRIPLEVPNDVKTDRVVEAVSQYLQPGLRDQLRQYLTRLRDAQYQIPAAVQKQIQDDFVEMRQMDSKKVTADSLHSLLTLSRLMSISRGDRELRMETWDHVMRMEAARQARQSAA